ncbi:MAG: hypothetical protein AAF773_21180 [Cyanobacteria bacterium P01_D01_bin.115]
MKVASSHKNLLTLLQKKEISGDVISEEEILEVTEWQSSTFRTYWNKGQLSDFLNEVSDGSFEASNSIEPI